MIFSPGQPSQILDRKECCLGPAHRWMYILFVWITPLWGHLIFVFLLLLLFHYNASAGKQCLCLGILALKLTKRVQLFYFSSMLFHRIIGEFWTHFTSYLFYILWKWKNRYVIIQNIKHNLFKYSLARL